jgi:hypothetical protein
MNKDVMQKVSEQMAQPAKALAGAVASGGTSVWILIDHITSIVALVGALASAAVSVFILINYVRKHRNSKTAKNATE